MNPDELREKVSKAITFNCDKDGEVDYQALRESVFQCLRELDLSQYSWSKYYFTEDKKYTRNLVCEGENFEIMILCWSKGVKSVIHDHPTNGCFIVGIEGEILEKKYVIDSDKKLKLVSEANVKKGDVSWMHDSQGLHSVGNPSEDLNAVTLHIYCPPILRANAYSEDGSKILRKSTYYSVHGKIVEN